MIRKIFMPKAGMIMETGTVVTWLKKIGDYVEQGEPLLMIETDKVNMEVESLYSGFLLKLIADEGDVVPVTQTIAYLGEQGDSLDDYLSAHPAPSKEKINPHLPTVTGGEDPYDMIVIGGGPAGYRAAIRGGELGHRVLLFEGGQLGGTCLNRGCVPTKAYLESAALLDQIKQAEEFGLVVNGSLVRADLGKIYKRKEGITEALREGLRQSILNKKVEIIDAVAEIEDAHTVVANGQSYRTGAIVYAGGSQTGKPEIEGINHSKVLTSDDLLDLRETPEHLVIWGSGVIGTEFATAFHSFGSKVTILAPSGRIISAFDSDLAKALHTSMEERGIQIITDASVTKIIDEKGRPTIVLKDGRRISASHILLALGRKAGLKGSERANLRLTDDGFIAVDDRMETAVKGIYAPGDCNGLSRMAHSAMRMGEIAAEQISGMDSRYKGKNIPACIYSNPEVAAVGMHYEDAKEQYPKAELRTMSYKGNGRALAAGKGEGFVKMVIDGQAGQLLGVHIVGASATEMINQAVVMIEMEMTVNEMREIVLAHPTYSEQLGFQ